MARPCDPIGRMSELDLPNPTPERLLAEIISNHFAGATFERRQGTYTVILGDGLPVIDCYINSLEEKPPHGAFFTLVLRGGALGPHDTVVTGSGYGQSMLEGLVVGGCTWACAFGPVLLAGIGQASRIVSEEPRYEQFETAIGGRRYLVTTGHLDRGGNLPIEEVSAYRERLGGPHVLTSMVLASGAIPASRSDDALALGCFVGSASDYRVTEVKLGAGDWAPGRAVLESIPQERGMAGMCLLREWALLAPLEPAPPFSRDSLQRTLGLLRAAGDSPETEGGWMGGQTHGMVLGPPAQLPVPMPPDAAWFFSEIAASGAGPGYGLALAHIEGPWWRLAQAGCGAEWIYNTHSGAVWLDSRACDDSIVQVAPSFRAWYEGWLDNAIRGGGPFARWSYEADAANKMLAEMAEQSGVESLPEVCTRVKIFLDGVRLGPCHACERDYHRLGVPSAVFTAD